MAKFYLAYGSNLSVEQMLRRCPNAIYVGKTELEGYRLVFRGSRSGSYLTIEPARDHKVPCLVWKVNDKDEKNLDYYEGFPNYYVKKDFKIQLFDLAHDVAICALEAFAYVMVAGRPLGTPSSAYFATCAEGYMRFGFDTMTLITAYAESDLIEKTETIKGWGK